MTAPPRSQPITETPYTPTPWRFVPWHIEEGPSAVRAPAGHIVCTTASDADAQIIVEAVNSHATLKSRIEELERVVGWVESWVENPVGAYSVYALDGLFRTTREKIAALQPGAGS